MCGIFGHYSFFGYTFDESHIQNMSTQAVHRGPDGTGIYYSPTESLGNNRLAIIDIEGGTQPFYSQDKNVIVVQNGEIFNHVELQNELENLGVQFQTSSDTEVILRLYEHRGIEGLKSLNGMFAISIYDRNKDEMYLFRDRVGEKPLYYHISEGQFIYASEIKSILSVLDKNEVSVDSKSMDMYFAFNYIPQPYTIFEDIYHVKPGHFITISRSGFQESEWWSIENKQESKLSESDNIEEFNRIFEDAVKIRLRADVDFGAFLSGGIDSSSVVGVMSKLLSSPVRTYNIGFDDKRFDESQYALSVSNRFNTKHISEIVEPNMLSSWPRALFHCDQPHGDISFLPTLRVAELASRDVKMVLTGDGADELFAGYDKYINYFDSEINTSFSNYYKQLELFSYQSRKKLFSDKVNSQLDGKDILKDIVSALSQECSELDDINKALYIDTKLLLSGNNLVKPDRMGMAVSIENRAPFMDYRMVEFAFKVPGKLKLQNGITKYIYKRAVEDLLGQELTYRKKQMFTVPVGEWLKTDAKEYCFDLLLSDKFKNRGFFDQNYVEELIDKHMTDKANHTREIRSLMAFELWCQELLDK
ncbi:asparagine synthase (glutamine-hydrolyzing) [Vibrio splendidus]